MDITTSSLSGLDGGAQNACAMAGGWAAFCVLRDTGVSLLLLASVLVTFFRFLDLDEVTSAAAQVAFSVGFTAHFVGWVDIWNGRRNLE
jgi:hypothetical protein